MNRSFVGGVCDGQLPLMLMMHFPRAKAVADLSCGECEDFKMEVCGGRGLTGQRVIDECMAGTGVFLVCGGEG